MNILRILLFLAMAVATEFYSFIVVRSAVKNLSSAWSRFFIILYIILSIAAWVVLIAFRAIDWDNFPIWFRSVLISFLMGFFIGKVLVFAVMLLDDLRRLILHFTQNITLKTAATDPEELDEVVKGTGITRSVFLTRLSMTLGLTSIVGFIYGMSNRYRYKVRRVQMSFPNMPEAFKGFKIVQLSDIHSGSFDHPEKVLRGIKMVNKLKPDVIFFTGDLVNNIHEEAIPYMPIFSQLKAPYGVYSTLGNHDYGDYVEWKSLADKKANLEALKAIHGKMGWRLLMNEHVILEKEGALIAVLGVENWSAKARFPKFGRLDEAYKGLESKNIPFKVLLSHDPSHWDAQVLGEYPDIDLTLSGHTHGMQFGIDIPGMRWSPVQFVYKNWIDLYKSGKQYLYVNRGFGFLGYPGRLGIMPEITLIEFV